MSRVWSKTFRHKNSFLASIQAVKDLGGERKTTGQGQASERHPSPFPTIESNFRLLLLLELGVSILGHFEVFFQRGQSLRGEGL
jgi:hypothetical protein